MNKQFEKKHSIMISEYQRQFLLKVVGDYIKSTKKKDFPVSSEVEKLEETLLSD